MTIARRLLNTLAGHVALTAPRAFPARSVASPLFFSDVPVDAPATAHAMSDGAIDFDAALFHPAEAGCKAKAGTVDLTALDATT